LTVHSGVVAMRLCEHILGKNIVTSDGKKIGKIYDIIASRYYVFPRVSIAVINPKRTIRGNVKIRQIIRSVKDRKHKSFMYLPWSTVDRIEKKIFLKIDEMQWKKLCSRLQREPKMKRKLSLAKDVLNEQIVDADNHFIDRVDDVKIEKIGSSWRVIGLDIGIEGAMERLGFERVLNKLGIKLPEKLVPWYLIERVTKKDKKLFLKIPAEIL
jgi:sporulation protein YlmC with PRC-barrel domain